MSTAPEDSDDRIIGISVVEQVCRETSVGLVVVVRREQGGVVCSHKGDAVTAIAL